jgi:hypothetical protein
MRRVSLPVLLLALVLLVMGIGAAWWATRGPTTEEDRVRATIQQAAEGAEEADLGEIMEVISDDYEDEGGIGKDVIRGLLFRQFQKRGPIHVTLGPISVVFQGEAEATASFQALLVERAPGTPWPTDGDAQHFDVMLENIDGDWLVVSHERRPATEGPPPGL